MRINEKEKYSLWVKPLLVLQKKNFGEVLNPSFAWGRKPRLFWLVALFFGFLDRKKSPIDDVTRSLICVRVSQLNDCLFCIDANNMRLLERCQSTEKAMALSNWQESSLFDEKEIAVLKYTEAMSYIEKKVTSEQVESLKKYYSDDDIVELTALIAFQNLSAKFNNALDVSSQGFCDISKTNSSTKD